MLGFCLQGLNDRNHLPPAPAVLINDLKALMAERLLHQLHAPIKAAASASRAQRLLPGSTCYFPELLDLQLLVHVCTITKRNINKTASVTGAVNM